MHFTGREHHTIDAKGRASMPATFRKLIRRHCPADVEARIMVLPWFGECARIYPFHSWEARLLDVESRLAKLDSFGYGEDESDLRRLIYGMAYDITMDAHGRFVFPQQVRDEAGLDREIYWVGLGEYIEVWEPARFHERLSGDNAKRLRQRLTALFGRGGGAGSEGESAHRAPEEID